MKTAFFAPKLLTQLPGDGTEALAALCAEFERFDGHARELQEHHDDYVEALGILRAFARARETQLEPFPEIGPQRRQNILNIKAYFSQLRDTVRSQLAQRHARGYLDAKTDEYFSIFAKVPAYEFSPTEFQEIQSILNELRDLLRANNLLADDQKNRLLRKLDAVRNELQRKTTDIDRFWGLLAECAIAMRKCGQDFRPISERVVNLAAIVVPVVFRKEGIAALPEFSQLLEIPQPETA